jgi:predicted amidohydrolase
MRVASIQLITSSDKGENLRKILYFIEKSSKVNADLVIFPEASNFFSPPNESFDTLYEKAEPIDGPWVNSLKKSTKENNINLVIGIYSVDNIFTHLKYLHLLSPPYLTNIPGSKGCYR